MIKTHIKTRIYPNTHWLTAMLQQVMTITILWESWCSNTFLVQDRILGFRAHGDYCNYHNDGAMALNGIWGWQLGVSQVVKSKGRQYSRTWSPLFPGNAYSGLQKGTGPLCFPWTRTIAVMSRTQDPLILHNTYNCILQVTIIKVYPQIKP